MPSRSRPFYFNLKSTLRLQEDISPEFNLWTGFIIWYRNLYMFIHTVYIYTIDTFVQAYLHILYLYVLYMYIYIYVFTLVPYDGWFAGSFRIFLPSRSSITSRSSNPGKAEPGSRKHSPVSWFRHQVRRVHVPKCRRMLDM